MKLLRGIGMVLAVAVFLLASTALAARFMDGPWGLFKGGAFRSGVMEMEPPLDWSFVRDTETVELQLLNPLGSRTTWILYLDGGAYIPCGIPQFRLWKQWPHHAVKDGRALLRVGERVFPRQLLRVKDEALHARLRGVLKDKYEVDIDDPEIVWMFHLAARG